MEQIYKSQAFAKINLGLFVHGKRPDGFHELETVFQQLSLADNLFFEDVTSGIEVVCEHPRVPSGSGNICYQAVVALQKIATVPHGIRIVIKKNIPVGAGLGGGSSDCAAVLMFLNKHWRLGLSLEELSEIGLTLGSDVPFFIYGGTMYAQGRGEILTPISVDRAYACLLVYPGIGISTAWVYRNYKISLTNMQKKCKLQNILPQTGVVGFGRCLRNDLESVILPEYPVIASIKKRLKQMGALVSLMSGSGSTVFGLFDPEKEIESKWPEVFPETEFRVFLTRPL